LLIVDDLLMSGSRDNTIKYWKISSGECIKTLEAHNGPIWSIELLSDETLVSISEDRTIKFWQVTN